MDEKYIQDLYNNLGGEKMFGQFNDFSTLISTDDGYRKDFYDNFGSDILGQFEDFDRLVKKKNQLDLRFAGQLDYSQDGSIQQQPGSENTNEIVSTIPQPTGEDLIREIAWDPEEAAPAVTIGSERDFQQLQQDTEQGNLGLKNPFMKDLMNAPAPIMRKEDVARNAKEVVTRFQEDITGQPESQGFIGDIAADLKQIPPSFNKGVVLAASAIPKGVGILAQGFDRLTGVKEKPIEEYATYKLGDWIEKKAQEVGITAIDEKRAGFINSEVPLAFGQMIGMILTGGTGSTAAGLGTKAPGFLAKYGGQMASGGLQASVPEFEAAKRAGATDEKAFEVFLSNIPGGTTEVIPIANMFGRLNKMTGNGVINAMKTMTAQGLEEASQEAVQQYLSNKVAQGTYDPKRDLTEGLLQGAGTGFIVGFLMPGIIASMDAMTDVQKEETKKVLEEILKKSPEQNIKAPTDDLGVKQPETTQDGGPTVSTANKPVEPTAAGSEKQGGKKEVQPSTPAVGQGKTEAAASVLDDEIGKEKVGIAITDNGKEGQFVESQDGYVYKITKVLGDRKFKIQDQYGNEATVNSEMFDMYSTDKTFGKVKQESPNVTLKPEDKIKETFKAFRESTPTFELKQGDRVVDPYTGERGAISKYKSGGVGTIKLDKGGEKPSNIGASNLMLESEYDKLKEIGLDETDFELIRLASGFKNSWHNPVLRDNNNLTEKEQARYDELSNLFEPNPNQPTDEDAEEVNFIKQEVGGNVIYEDIDGNKYEARPQKGKTNYDIFKNGKKLEFGAKKFADIAEAIKMHRESEKEASESRDPETDKTDYSNIPTAELQSKLDKEKDFAKMEAMKKELDKRKTKQEEFNGYKVIGVNKEGNKVGEKPNGHRAVLSGNIVRQQPVNFIPGGGTTFSEPEGQFLTVEESKAKADKIAQDNGFKNASHLLNSVEKYSGQKFENVQDIPKDVLNDSIKKRDQLKEGIASGDLKQDGGKIVAVNEKGAEILNEVFGKEKPTIKEIVKDSKGQVLLVKPAGQSKSDEKFAKAHAELQKLDELLKPGRLSLNEDYTPDEFQQIAIQAGKVVAAYMDAGVTRFGEIIQQIYQRFGAEAAKKYFEPLKQGYGRQYMTVENADESLEEQLAKASSKAAKEGFEDFKGAMSTALPLPVVGQIKKTPSNNALLNVIATGIATKEQLEKELEEKVKIANPAVEVRFNEAQKPEARNMETLWDRVKLWVHEFTQPLKYLDVNKYPREANLLREFKTVMTYVKEMSAGYVKNVVSNLTPTQYKVLSRRIILADLLESIDNPELNMQGVDGKYPFGFETRDEIQAEYDKYDKFMNGDAQIKDAFEMREQFMNQFKKLLIESGLMDDADIQSYYHRRVLEYRNDVQHDMSILFGRDIGDKKRSFQRKRTGTRGMDYSTNFIETDFKVVTEGLYEIEKRKILNDIMAPFEKELADLKKAFAKGYDAQLETLKKNHGKDSPEVDVYKKSRRALQQRYLEAYMPEGYVFWRISDENRLFWGKSITESAIDEVLDEAQQHDASGMSAAMQIVDGLINDGVRPALMVGAKPKEYMIPEQLARQLDFMAQNEHTSTTSNLANQVTGVWKQIMLLSPFRLMRYNINNLGSDIDRTIQVEPQIAKYATSSFKELWDYTRKGITTPQLLEAMRGGVIDSGFQISEIADLSELEWAKAVQGEATAQALFGRDYIKQLAINTAKKPGNLWKRYVEAISPYVQLRENVLRYAAYKLALEKINLNQKFYWASDRGSIDAIPDKRQRAAKLAREVYGDYRNISVTGESARRLLLPFYSWFEINMKTHYRLLKNASPVVQRKMIRSAVMRGIPATTVRVALAYARIGLVTAAIQLWNEHAAQWLFGGDDDDDTLMKKLLRSKAKGMNIIVGRDKQTGEFKVLPVQGAFYDFIEFFGIPVLWDDIDRVISGEDKIAAIKDTGKEIAGGMANRGVQLMTPFLKSPYEFAAKQSYFPNVFAPVPFNDRWEYAAKSLTLGDEYNYFLTDKPQKENYLSRKWNNSFLLREIDVEQLTYYQARAIVQQYTGKKMAGAAEPVNPTAQKKSEALHNFMMALKRNQLEAADKYILEFYLNGGKKSDLKTAVNNTDPLSGLAKKAKPGEYKSEYDDVLDIIRGQKPTTYFGKQLTSDEILVFRDAMDYFYKIKVKSYQKGL